MSTRSTTRLALALLLANATAASANVYEIYGFGPRAIGMAGAMTAAATDYTATYYNPGALTADKQARLGLSFSLNRPRLYVDRRVADPEAATELPPTNLGFAVGWLYSFGGIFRDRLALGLSFHLPSKRLARVQAVDANVPHFTLYQSLHDKLLLHASVAGEIVPGLSLGAGVQVLANLSGTARLDLDVIDGRFEQRSVSVELTPTVSAIVGLHLRPIEGMAIGFAWRQANSVSFALPVTVAEGEALTLDFDVRQTVLYSPHQLALGFSYLFDALDLTVAIDASLSLWSKAPDPSTQIRGDIGGALLDGLGLGDALDLSLDTPRTSPGFRDTVNVRIGFEWQARPFLLLRTGYGFRPTPVPRQTGLSAYLDNDAHIVALGAGFVFQDPLKVHVHPIQLDLGFMASVLPRRTVVRDTPGDPIGDLSHGGVVWTVSASISHAY
ncbi:MAG: outer membrane protein transport protein [Deltaproteobacteria bacterium]|nr:outer membrane protein transport protein [Deltaproteobacteria bacterium]MCB9785831.1 outer membrane protein transport protein [Deltaproteobacteria bacterium]